MTLISFFFILSYDVLPDEPDFDDNNIDENGCDTCFCQPSGERMSVSDLREKSLENLRVFSIKKPLLEYYNKPPKFYSYTIDGIEIPISTAERNEFIDRGPNAPSFLADANQIWDTRRQSDIFMKRRIDKSDYFCKTDKLKTWYGPNAYETDSEIWSYWFPAPKNIKEPTCWRNNWCRAEFKNFNKDLQDGTCWKEFFHHEDYLALYNANNYIINATDDNNLFKWRDYIRWPRELPAPRFLELSEDFFVNLGHYDIDTKGIIDEMGPPTDIIVLPPYGFPGTQSKEIANVLLKNVNLLINCENGFMTHNIQDLRNEIKDLEETIKSLTDLDAEGRLAEEDAYYLLLKMLLEYNEEYAIALENVQTSYYDVFWANPDVYGIYVDNVGD